MTCWLYLGMFEILMEFPARSNKVIVFLKCLTLLKGNSQTECWLKLFLIFSTSSSFLGKREGGIMSTNEGAFREGFPVIDYLNPLSKQ